jgi:hypothetical protein
VVNMIYDSRDRLVMMNDGNMRGNHQWLVTKYENDLNRPIATYLITDPSNYNNPIYHRDQAKNIPSATIPSYPAISSYTNELLSETNYDDYNNLPSNLLSGSLNASGYNTYLNAPASFYPEPLLPSLAVKGMVTWTKVKVLGTSDFISSVNIYE